MILLVSGWKTSSGQRPGASKVPRAPRPHPAPPALGGRGSAGPTVSAVSAVSEVSTVQSPCGGTCSRWSFLMHFYSVERDVAASNDNRNKAAAAAAGCGGAGRREAPPHALKEHTLSPNMLLFRSGHFG